MEATPEFSRAAPLKPLAWVVGSNGLLGRHVLSILSDSAIVFDSPFVPWSDPPRAQQVLREGGARLVERADRVGRPWRVFWCAGAGVTSTGPEMLGHELEAFEALLDRLSGPGGAETGTVFLASSVGGIYAGNPDPPYSEASAPRPLAPYGQAKLEAESRLMRWAEQTGGTAVVGRISNLYGAGQNLAKPQGLISQLCANYVRRRPSSIWVSLDTIRDYVYVDDCAQLVVDVTDRAAVSQATVTKILASGQPVPISGILGELKRVLGRRPEILLGSSSASAFQALDLSVRSEVWPDLDRRAWTPLAVGISRTIADLQLAWGQRGLSL